MNKFIFVCYDHGTGGENLSLQISKKQYCQTLEHHAQGGRTWTVDVFDKSLLSLDKNWYTQIPHIGKNKLWYVVPSHFTPDEIKQHLPKSLFVVINYPKEYNDQQHLRQRIYEKVWMTSQHSLSQKIGFCKWFNYNIDSKEKLQAVDKSLNNAHIHCIMHGLEYNQSNVDMLFDKLVTVDSGMDYKDDAQTIVLEYNAFDEQKLDRLNELCVLYR